MKIEIYFSVVSKVTKTNFDFVCNQYGYSSNELLKMISFVLNYKGNNLSIERKRELYEILKRKLMVLLIRQPRVGVISDLHIRDKEKFDKIKCAYRTFKTERINTVLCLGDVFDSYNKIKHQELCNYEKKQMCYRQIETFANKMPYGFATYIIGGNHDILMQDHHISLDKEISSRRRDIQFLGYGRVYISFQGKILLLSHELNRNFELPPLIENDLNLAGHSHKFKYDTKKRIVSVPACSDNQPNTYYTANMEPGFLILSSQRQELHLERYSFTEKGAKKVLHFPIK